MSMPRSLNGRRGRITHIDQSKSLGLPKSLADDYYAKRAEQAVGLGKRAMEKKMGRGVTPEKFAVACYALWCIEKEFTQKQIAAVLGVDPIFVKKVSNGTVCSTAVSRVPPDPIIEALSKL